MRGSPTFHYARAHGGPSLRIGVCCGAVSAPAARETLKGDLTKMQQMSPVHYESSEAPLQTLLSSERSSGSGSSLNRVLPALFADRSILTWLEPPNICSIFISEKQARKRIPALPRASTEQLHREERRSHSTAHQAIRSNAQHVQASERIPATPPLRTSPLSPQQIWARTAAPPFF